MSRDITYPTTRLLIGALVIMAALLAWRWRVGTPPAAPEADEKPVRVDREATLLFVDYPAAEAAAVTNPHVYKGRPLCQRCHLYNTASLTSPPSKLCSACHGGPHVAHRTDVRQPTPMKLTLPLGPNDTLLCHTCHDHHDVYRHPGGLRAEPEILCSACHSPP